jgi:hypothetical protein
MNWHHAVSFTSAHKPILHRRPGTTSISNTVCICITLCNLLASPQAMEGSLIKIDWFHARSFTSARKPTIPSAVPHPDIIQSVFVSYFVIHPQDHKPTNNGRQFKNEQASCCQFHISPQYLPHNHIKLTIHTTVPHLDRIPSVCLSYFMIRPHDHKPTNNERQF